MTITFDPIQFKLDFPQFAGISDNKLTNDFNFQACVLGQVVSSLFIEDDVKYYWLCLVLAHILTCTQNGLVGRPDSVTQGSESASFAFDSPQWAAWWANTPYGQVIYQCMLEYLAGGHYISNGEMPYLGDSMQLGNNYGDIGYVY